MRVIAGEFRRRVLKSVRGLDVRPTPDRLREALFNILAPRIDGMVFGDLYAGTGAVGIEALSRGAARGIFIEQNKAAVAVIRENLKSLGLTDRAVLRQTRASAVVGSIEADIIFVDPPYSMEGEYERVLTILGERKGGLVIVQHDSRLKLKEEYGHLKRRREVRQGDNVLTFYD